MGRGRQLELPCQIVTKSVYQNFWSSINVLFVQKLKGKKEQIEVLFMCWIISGINDFLKSCHQLVSFKAPVSSFWTARGWLNSLRHPLPPHLFLSSVACVHQFLHILQTYSPTVTPTHTGTGQLPGGDKVSRAWTSLSSTFFWHFSCVQISATL